MVDKAPFFTQSTDKIFLTLTWKQNKRYVNNRNEKHGFKIVLDRPLKTFQSTYVSMTATQSSNRAIQEELGLLQFMTNGDQGWSEQATNFYATAEILEGLHTLNFLKVDFLGSLA